jgi:hypothetical protein
MLPKMVGEHSHPKSTPTRPHPGYCRRDAISRLIRGFGTGTCPPPRSKLERPRECRRWYRHPGRRCLKCKKQIAVWQPTLPCKVRCCCFCVKHTLVTRRVLYQKIINPSKVSRGCCFCIKHALVTRCVLYQEIIKPWDTLPTKAMVTLTSGDSTLPREVRGCCSCVKRALVTRQVLYQEIISPNCRDVQGCCSCVKHSVVTSRILYQEIISQVHVAMAIAMLTQCKRCAPRRD